MARTEREPWIVVIGAGGRISLLPATDCAARPSGWLRRLARWLWRAL